MSGQHHVPSALLSAKKSLGPRERGHSVGPRAGVDVSEHRTPNHVIRGVVAVWTQLSHLL